MSEFAFSGSGLGLAGGTLMLLIGAGALVKTRQEFGPALAIFRNDPLAVQDLVYHDGPAEVEGIARGDEKGVEAPFTGTVCLAYEYEVQEYRSSGKSSYWKTLDEGTNSVPFLVEDDTGRVQIDGANAELHLSSETLELSPGEEPPARIDQYIQQTDDIEQQDSTLDLGITELNFGNKQRFIERRLDIDESVHVYGTVGRAPAGEWGSDLVDAMLTSSEKTPLVISDGSERDTAWRIVKGHLGWPLLALGCLLIGLYGIALGIGPLLA
ncbi:GIDE domain-containing protein [Halovenus sp. HT40]|uniref:GIDE domain-containing protein n=1 Tax=Halovenus sp. HT40 TaxID=3126691 RepID=UPI00300F0FFE